MRQCQRERSEGNQVELLKILQDDAVEVLSAVRHQTQQWQSDRLEIIGLPIISNNAKEGKC